MGTISKKLLENYATRFDLRPVFNANVLEIWRDGRRWRIDAGENSVSAPVVVAATGWGDFRITRYGRG